MQLNPEFHRQLLLEYSTARLIGAPLVLWVVFSLSYYIDGYNLGSTTAKTALILFLLITLLWGVQQTRDSMLDEFRNHTWNTQRLSALGPWDMTWGKLLGSTVMVWYSGLICLGVFATATDDLAALPIVAFYCISAGLFMQSGGLLMAQMAVQRNETKSSSIFIMAIIALIFITPKLTAVSSLGMFFPAIGAPIWYEFSFNQQLFNMLSVFSALFWCSVGNYRLMSQALGIRTLPWIWLTFSAFLIIYFGGFLPSSVYSIALAAFAVCIVLSYIGILVEPNDAMRLKCLQIYAEQRNWRRFAEELPIWWLSFSLAIPFALILSLSEHPLGLLGANFHIYPLPILLLLLRDCCIYLFFSYGKNPQRAFNLTLLSAALLYGIIPGLFSFAGQPWLAALAFPLWADSASSALIFSLLQIGFLGQLVYKRWQASV